MKKILMYITLIVVILIIIIIVTLLLLINNKELTEAEFEVPEEPTLTALEPETNNYTYLFCDEIINKFFDNIKGEEVYVYYEEAILAVLDKEYINENQLTEENVLSFFDEYKNINSYGIKEIYSQDIGFRQNSNGKYIYTKGILRKNGEEEYIYILIKEDYENNTYSLSIINEEEYNNIKYGGTNNDTTISIEINNYNEIYSKSITEYQMCLNFFTDYINTIENNPKYGYELLDETYSKEKFENLEEYEKYIQELGNLNELILKEYSISEKEGYKQYVGIDNKGNYYIFKVESAMQYTLILDTYTIDIPEFTNKYNEATDQEKVILNLNKFMLAINDKDYKYAYSVLADSFKTKNFPTYESFETYAKSNFFEKNEFNYIEFGNEAGTYYTYRVNITSASETSSNVITKTFIMVLGEGTEFKMSFNLS